MSWQINNGAEPVGKVYFDQATNEVVFEAMNGKPMRLKSDDIRFEYGPSTASPPPPVGATYIQFPTMVDPGTLWPGTTWQKKFDSEGIFFRTEGGEALDFGGGIQNSANLGHGHTIYGRGSSYGAGAVASYWSNQSRLSAGPDISPFNFDHESAASGDTEARSTNRTFRVWGRLS